MISRVLEANPEELLDLETDSMLTPELRRYVSALIAFHRGDRLGVVKELRKAQNESPESPIIPLIKMREQYLAAQPDLPWISSLREEAETRFGDWQGEFWSLYASLLTLADKHDEAREPFKKAAAEYLKIRAPGRAMRCEFNAINALGNIDPNRKLIPEFTYFYKKAKKHRQWNLAATALLNLSREYQKMGAFRVALKFCNRAAICCKNEIGSLTHFLVVVHRAHLFFQLERTHEAITDLEYARTTDFQQIRAACQVLEETFAKQIGRPPETAQLLDPAMSSTWRERLEEFRAAKALIRTALSPTEEKLVSLVIEAPRDRFELYEQLFGKDVHPFTAENRLKNLLGRIRKKFPGLIVNENEKYRLADDSPALATPKKKTGT